MDRSELDGLDREALIAIILRQQATIELRGVGRRGPGRPRHLLGRDRSTCGWADRLVLVFQAPSASYHAIVPRRNAEVITALLGDAHPEGWVSDLWSPQLHVDAEIHRIRLAHQIRNLTYAVEADGYTGGSGPSNCAICSAGPSTCTRSASANSASASGSQCFISIER